MSKTKPKFKIGDRVVLKFKDPKLAKQYNGEQGTIVCKCQYTGHNNYVVNWDSPQLIILAMAITSSQDLCRD